MKKVLLLLANGYETYEASVFIDVIGWNYVEGDRTTQLHTCGITKEVRTSFAQRSIVDFLIEEINVDDYDALAIPGGFGEYDFYKDAFDERFLNLIKAFYEKEKIIASICVAALPLGRSGILKGRKGTTYNKNKVRQEQLSAFGVEIIQEPIVMDGNIITSWNPSTAIHVAFLLLQLLTSRENVGRVKNLMGYMD
jgi:protein deglycase